MSSSLTALSKGASLTFTGTIVTASTENRISFFSKTIKYFCIASCGQDALQRVFIILVRWTEVLVWNYSDGETSVSILMCWSAETLLKNHSC